jgi:hypothetical protein
MHAHFECSQFYSSPILERVDIRIGFFRETVASWLKNYMLEPWKYNNQMGKNVCKFS